VCTGGTASLTHACVGPRATTRLPTTCLLLLPASSFPNYTAEIFFFLPLNLIMTSATPTRRVLSALDVNTPTPRSVAPSRRAKAGSPEKPQKMGEGISLQTFEHSLRDVVHKEGRVDVGKRSFSPVATVSTSCSKRQKTGTGNEKGYGVAFNTQKNTSTFELAQALPKSQSFTYEVSSKQSTLLSPSPFHLSTFPMAPLEITDHYFLTFTPDWMLIGSIRTFEKLITYLESRHHRYPHRPPSHLIPPR
jgi:hypothetical protein